VLSILIGEFIFDRKLRFQKIYRKIEIMTITLRIASSILKPKAFYRWNSTLILSEPFVAKLSSVATLSAATAATQLGSDQIFLVVFGKELPIQTPEGITSILHLPALEMNTKTLHSVIEDAVVKHNCTHVVASTPLFLTEVSKQLNIPIVMDVVKIDNRERFRTGDDRKETYVPDTLKMLCIRPSAFAPALLREPVVATVLQEDSKAVALTYKIMPIFLLFIGLVMVIPD
jgi:hypothetical protein